MAIKRKHHYVPRYYLQGFTDSSKGGFLHVYNRTSLHYFKANPLDSACERDFYTITYLNDPADSEAFENYLQIVEDAAKPAFDKIKTRQLPTQQEKSNLAIFIAFCYCRIPRFIEYYESRLTNELNIYARENVKNVDVFYNSVRSIEEASGKKIDFDPEEDFRKPILSGDLKFKATRNNSLKMLCNLPFKIAEILFNMKWNYYTSNSEIKLLSSDSPVSVHNPEDKGFYTLGILTKSTRILFPVTKDLALIMQHREGVEQFISPIQQQIKQFNRLTALNAKKYIYSAENNPKLLKLLEHINQLSNTNEI